MPGNELACWCLHAGKVESPDMETLQRTFLESPLYVYVFLAFAELALAAIWHERRTRRLAMSLLVPPAMAAIVFAVSTLVVTDRERLIQAAEKIARNAENGSIAAAVGYLDDNYHGLGGDKQGLIDEGNRMLSQFRIKKIRFTSMNVEVQGQTAVMNAGTIIEFTDGQYPLAWEVGWIKRPQGWRIIDIAQPQQKLQF